MKNNELNKLNSEEVVIQLQELLRHKPYVRSVALESNAIIITYNNGFKSIIEVPLFDNNRFQEECLKHVNIKMLQQKSEILAVTKKVIANIKKKEGPVGPAGKQGKKGEKGDKGNGIKSAEIEQDGHLIIKTDDKEIDAGEVSAKRFYGGIGTITYSNELPMPSKVGGLKKGTRFANVDFRTMLTKLLYGYDFPFFNIFTITGLTTEVEIGYTIAATTHQVTFEIQNTELLKADTIQIKQNGVALASSLHNVSPVDVDVQEVTEEGLGSSTFEILAYDTTGVSFNSYFTVSFLYKIYYGEYTDDITDHGFANYLSVLRATELVADISAEYLYLGVGYKWFCYPSAMGENYVFYEKLSDLGIVMDAVRKIIIENEHGLMIEYNCYRSLYEMTEEFTMEVKNG